MAAAQQVTLARAHPAAVSLLRHGLNGYRCTGLEHYTGWAAVTLHDEARPTPCFCQRIGLSARFFFHSWDNSERGGSKTMVLETEFISGVIAGALGQRESAQFKVHG